MKNGLCTQVYSIYENLAKLISKIFSTDIGDCDKFSSVKCIKYILKFHNINQGMHFMFNFFMTE